MKTRSANEEVARHQNALDLARAYFGDKTPTYVEALRYGNQVRFDAMLSERAKGNWAGQNEAAEDAMRYARNAALDLCLAAAENV